MAQTEPEARRQPRQFHLRWIVIACGLFFAFFAWLEPHRIWLSIVGFTVVVALAILVPRRMLDTAAPAGQSSRHTKWPDTSTKAMAEALGYPVYIFDAATVLRYANASAQEAFGPSRAGDPLSYKFRRPEIARLLDEVVKTGIRSELEYQERVPHERWYAASAAPIPVPTAGAGPNFYFLSFVDLTEIKRAEQMRSDFVANASHELRTPLASLRGFIETIQGPAASDREATSKFLALMLQQAERMSRLIDDLLSLSRIEMKSHIRPGQSVDIASVLQHVANALEPMASELGVEIAVTPPQAGLVVTGDRDELIQVVENLIENACKYGQSGHRVEVSAALVPGLKPEPKPDEKPGAAPQVEVTVRDFGPGIPAEHQPRLTERFYRVDVASSREKQGTGLGLAIVKHILNRHGSRLVVASKVGEGATFSFRLPSADGQNLGQTEKHLQSQ